MTEKPKERTSRRSKLLILALLIFLASNSKAEYYFVTNENEACIPHKFKYHHKKFKSHHKRYRASKDYYHQCQSCFYQYKESYQGDLNPDMRTADDISIFPNLDIDD